MRNIYHHILEQIRSGSRPVLATIVRSSGSTPQKPGSSALFGKSGLLCGTVGGGPMEEEIGSIAGYIQNSGASDYFHFNLDAEAGSNGAICGGEALVLVDADPALHEAVLETMARSLAGGSGGILLTLVSHKEGPGRNISRIWISGTVSEDFPDDMDPDLKDLIGAHAKQAEKVGFAEIGLSSFTGHRFELAFLEAVSPLPRLVIVGAGHVGKALAHLGSLLDFEVSVLDDRPEYASRDHVPDALHLIVGDAGMILKEIKPGPDTYIVIVTRGHQLDGEALRACIGSGAAYIGMIGSKKKVARMKQQFLEEGWATPGQWSAIHTPVGLPIGSVTVQEIAISIAAQLVQVRNMKTKLHGK